MTKIAIFADSSTDINFEMGEKYGIEVVPYNVQMGDKTYIDMVEITNREFYETMGDYDVLKTAVPPVQRIIDKFDEVADAGYEEAVLVTSTTNVTGMKNAYQAAMEDYGRLKFHLFESDYLAAATGLMVVHAASMRDDGASGEEILAELERLQKNADLFALFRTLTYIVKGGRYSRSKGMVGNILKVMPLLTLQDGDIVPIQTFRGMKKSHKGFIEKVREELGDKQNYMLALFSSNNPDEITEIMEEIPDIVDGAQTFIRTELTPLLGVHAGPDLIGFAYVLLD